MVQRHINPCGLCEHQPLRVMLDCLQRKGIEESRGVCVCVWGGGGGGGGRELSGKTKINLPPSPDAHTAVPYPTHFLSFLFPYLFNICTKLESYCFSGFGVVVKKKNPFFNLMLPWKPNKTATGHETHKLG